MLNKSAAPAPNLYKVRANCNLMGNKKLFNEMYQVKDLATAKNASVAAEAAFKSTSKRGPIQAGSTRIPSPST